MKKQKFMKLTAFASAPSMENSFSAPETHNGEISIVFSGKNVKIHGWDGSAWSVIYTWNSADKQFTFDNTYQNYFLESLTGGNETISVSFFSVNRYQGSTPALAGVNREVKLYDIEEVPIYTPSDVGKMLTIMSDGSLRWLGASVTWMIDGSPVSESIIGLEDEPSLVLVNGAQYANGELTLSRSLSQYAYLADNDDYDYTGTDMTISGKFKMNGGLGLGDQTIFSKLTGKTAWDGYVINLMQAGDFRYYLAVNGNNSANSWDTPISVNTDQWYSFSLVIRPSKNISLWFDGVNVDNRTVSELAANVVQPLVFGALWTNNPGYTNFFDGSLKDFKIHKRELTSDEIMNLHNGVGISDTVNSYSETIVLDGNGQTFVRANGDVLNLGDNPSYDRVDGEDFAVEGEFKLASTYGSATWDIVGKGQTSGWWGWAVMIYGGVIRMFAHSSGTAVSGHGMNATFSPVVGQWYHFKAIWKNDGKQEMWVDGVKLAERTVTSSGYFPPVDTAYDLQIGEVFTNSVRNFDGDIRNVKIQSGTIN